MPAKGLFTVLGKLFDTKELSKLKKGYEQSLKISSSEGRGAFFKGFAEKFAFGAAQAAGKGVVHALTALLGIQPI